MENDRGQGRARASGVVWQKLEKQQCKGCLFCFPSMACVRQERVNKGRRYTTAGSAGLFPWLSTAEAYRCDAIGHGAARAWRAWMSGRTLAYRRVARWRLRHACRWKQRKGEICHQQTYLAYASADWWRTGRKQEITRGPYVHSRPPTGSSPSAWRWTAGQHCGSASCAHAAVTPGAV
ncbi:hypothetical protein DL89DRAFT_24395 [Linderina pennispora]|uniref:Uncharacterized protein n=1 Tax=Linderina pennispora TaxID=61395 RepID=A0A1Y1WNQ2_9FUNG|nr:uncharacterized protein DL89DRAFT_24395 [Linderina pennispora]ORX74928.1 hypothetical protein DL89DRAFT_24395 [Linderina pennispora]